MLNIVNFVTFVGPVKHNRNFEILTKELSFVHFLVSE